MRHATQGRDGFNLVALDGLRGLAALYVVAHHARIYAWSGPGGHGASLGHLIATSSGVFRFGHQAVIVFFLLSGFVIHLRAARGLAAGELVEVRALRFLRRRATRLMPPLLFALALVVVLDAVGGQLDPSMYSAFTHDVATLALNVLFLQHFVARDFGSDNVLWSLAYEGAFYLLYPAFLAARLRTGARLAFGATFVIGAGGWVAYAVWPHVFVTIAPYFAIWAGGALLAEMFAREVTVRQPLIVLAGAAALSIAGLTMGTRFGEIAPDVMFAAGAAMAFALLVLHAWGRTAARGLARMQALGACSYTLYLTHVPLLVLLAAFWRSGHDAVPGSGWLAIAGVAIAVALAFSVAPLVEAPFARRTGALVRGREPVRRRARPVRAGMDPEFDEQGSEHDRRAA